jgi:hypothetical protein
VVNQNESCKNIKKHIMSLYACTLIYVPRLTAG